jgi:hypothetical protein
MSSEVGLAHRPNVSFQGFQKGSNSFVVAKVGRVHEQREDQVVGLDTTSANDGPDVVQGLLVRLRRLTWGGRARRGVEGANWWFGPVQALLAPSEATWSCEYRWPHGTNAAFLPRRNRGARARLRHGWSRNVQ